MVIPIITLQYLNNTNELLVLPVSNPYDYPDILIIIIRTAGYRFPDADRMQTKKPCMISIHAGPYMAGTVYFIYFRCAYLDVLISVSAWLAVFEPGHHLVCEAPVVWLQDDIFGLGPECAAELFVIHLDLVVTIEVTIESCEDVGGAAPGLGFVVADVLDLEADFFGDFALDGLFEGLANLSEACDQCIVGRIVVA